MGCCFHRILSSIHYIRRQKWRLCQFLFVLGTPFCMGQTTHYSTRTWQDNIRSLRVKYVNAATLQRPYLVWEDTTMPLNGVEDANTLEISFDELSHDFHQYSYTVYHLDKDWKRSALSSYEYLLGFTTADITDAIPSVNTQQVYMHYTFAFPNEDMQLQKSGNYVLLIYEDGDIEKLVAQVCFSVVEPLVAIAAEVSSNTDIEFDGRYQQLDVDVKTAGLSIHDIRNVSLVVQQNGRTDNRCTINAPTYVEPMRLRYCNQRALIFEGGNEFRHFDAYSAYYAGYHVDVIRYGQGEYHALLDADEVRGTLAQGAGREGSVYLTEQDNNGQLRINAAKAENADDEAEYMWVHFCLPMATPIWGGEVFVGGDIFQNRFTAANRMSYDAGRKCYYLYAYLKQGAYDYLYYVSYPKDRTAEQTYTLLPIEGSHWQTNNEYTIYVYYRPFGERYDRLVGLCVVN